MIRQSCRRMAFPITALVARRLCPKTRSRRLSPTKGRSPELMNPRRALVTGGAGFLGSHLCDALLGEGYSVAAVDSLLTGRLANLDHLHNEAFFEFRELDITRPFDCGEVDYVFHLACPA